MSVSCSSESMGASCKRLKKCSEAMYSALDFSFAVLVSDVFRLQVNSVRRSL